MLLANSLFNDKMSFMMKGKIHLYRLFVVTSVLLCIAGFIWNTFGTFENFILGAKIVQSDKQANEQLPLPVFVLCNDTGYKEIPFWEDGIWQEDQYLKITRNPEEMVTPGPFNSSLNLTKEDLYTAEYGRCSVIRSHQKVI